MPFHTQSLKGSMGGGVTWKRNDLDTCGGNSRLRMRVESGRLSPGIGYILNVLTRNFKTRGEGADLPTHLNFTDGYLVLCPRYIRNYRVSPQQLRCFRVQRWRRDKEKFMERSNQTRCKNGVEFPILVRPPRRIVESVGMVHWSYQHRCKYSSYRMLASVSMPST